MFGVAGLIALYGVGVLIATAVLVLALVMDAWLAALIVAVVLLAVAGVAALLGKRRVEEAAPPVPNDGRGERQAGRGRRASPREPLTSLRGCPPLAPARPPG